MTLVLVGQPNCGKSTIFNAVAGFKAGTANFPGSSVTFTKSRVLVGGEEVDIVDLPGIYSLTLQDEAEREALRYLLTNPETLLINVLDATRLGRSLELTLQLMELGRPMVLALNMMDEAHRKGIHIEAGLLERELGIPVVSTVARRGLGVSQLLRTALRTAPEGLSYTPLPHDREVEAAITRIQNLVLDVPALVFDQPRLAAIKLLEHDAAVQQELSRKAPGLVREVQKIVADLEQVHGWPADQVVCGSRHALAHRIEDLVTKPSRPSPGWRERADQVLMHPVFGVPVLLAIMGAFFYSVFGAGKYLEGPITGLFDALTGAVAVALPADSLAGAIVQGVLLGIGGGVGIVFPFLVPFLFGLALLEDSGYLPRMAYLLDWAMHHLGLHGKSVVPLVLGYGCSVPAVMATRILESPRDRKITAALAILVPCSARTTVILGLAGALLGAGAALSLYLVNLAVTVLVGLALSRQRPVSSPGLILEVPDLRLPSPKAIATRTWVALREFIVVAWPLLVVSSIVLSVLQLGNLDHAINKALSPLTVTILGLPAACGLTLIFGVMRKELSLMMLVQALGTADLQNVLTPAQIIAFSLFIVFYIPCVATLAVLWRETGWKQTAWVTTLTLALAIGLAVGGRFAAQAIF